MTQFFYDIATTAAAPVAAAWLAVSKKHRMLLRRFFPPTKTLGSAPIWIHACSVGELGVARPLIAGLHQRHPEIPIMLTVSTRSAWEMAEDLQSTASLCWFPVDQRTIVSRFFDRVQPRLLALVETEIWPNILREAQHRNIPTLVVNGRISDKHLSRYLRFEGFFQTVFSRLTAAGVQRAAYADRFVSLGLDPARVVVTGNIKFDNVITAIDPNSVHEIKRTCGIPNEATVIVFGSTRPGDEALAAECWREWKATFPDAFLIIAPRHQNRLPEVLAPFDEPILLRSSIKAGHEPKGEKIIVLDTLGELISFYAAASVAVVGGSFFPGVNGHNPLEPAALGIPTVFGPYMSNFPDPAEALVAAGAAIQIETPGALASVVSDLLRDHDKRQSMADTARCAISENQGALNKSLDLIDTVLLKSSGKQ